MARRTSGRPRVAAAAQTRSDVHRASSRPPPSAIEEMALMLGIGSACRRVNVWRRAWRKARVLDM